MNITPSSFMTLQSYNLTRRTQKQQLIRHRRERSLALGPCMRLQFEDEMTIRYQILEVLHVERADGQQALREQIDTYAHLVPDGSQWKATLQIELPDRQERLRALPQLNEAVHHLYVEVPGYARVVVQANEDLPDRHRTRPSAVHFLRFQLPESMRTTLLAGTGALLGCMYDHYAFRRVIPPATLAQLRRDLTACTHKLDNADPAAAPSS